MSRTRHLLLLAAIAAPLGACASSAYRDDAYGTEPLVREFPVTDTAYVEPKGSLRTTGALSYARAGGEEFVDLVAGGEYGLARRFQVELEVPIRLDPSAGIDALRFGGLYGILTDRDELVLSGGLFVDLPVDGGKVAFTPFFAAARWFDPVEVHASLGLTATEDDADAVWSLAAATSLDRVRPTLELFGVGGAASVAPGVLVRVSDRADLGFGIPIGITGRAADWGVVAKLNVAW